MRSKWWCSYLQMMNCGRDLFFVALCPLVVSGPFTKVIGFDETKPSTIGTAGGMVDLDHTSGR